MSILIRKATLLDHKILQEIGRQTFLETFSGDNTEENMRQYLTEGFSAEKVTAELESADSEFYLAEMNGNTIGYLKLNSGNSQTELNDARSLEIERIYVLRAYHGKHVGQLLYDKAIEVARIKHAEYVWLGVWEANPRAIRFYEKNGFIPFDKHVFKLGDEEQTDIMMKLELSYQAES